MVRPGFLIILIMYGFQLVGQVPAHEFLVSGGLHGIVPNAPEFPEVQYPSASFSAQIYDLSFRRESSAWWVAMKMPRIYTGFKIQSLGNSDALGHAVTLYRGLEWRKRSGAERGITTAVAGGISWLTRSYDANDPVNLVNGGPFSFHLHTAFGYCFDRRFAMRFIWDHYSSGGRYAPNRGYNLLGIDASWKWAGKARKSRDLAATDALTDKGWHPFIRGIFGISRRNFNGPDYPVRGLQLGILKNSGVLHQWRFGLEGLQDESARVFLKETGIPDSQSRSESNRWLISFGHGYRMGPWVLVTDAAVYLTKHYNRGSVFSTRIGMEYQAGLPFPGWRGGFFAGIFVRSYGLEADFTEISTGICF